jgi:hypothetical protein
MAVGWRYIIKKADPPQGGAPQLLTPERSAVSFNLCCNYHGSNFSLMCYVYIIMYNMYTYVYIYIPSYVAIPNWGTTNNLANIEVIPRCHRPKKGPDRPARHDPCSNHTIHDAWWSMFTYLAI